MHTFKFGIQFNIESNKIDCAECKFDMLHIGKTNITNTSIQMLKLY